ncbi:MAG: PLP-dependent aminotransferase family protein [Cyanobacteria bacterium SZAS LIN-3]|nr:PLP-dependent aminotransferase family protein [Cyanobacteria bacterium SZAS LIN-3]
MNVLINIDNQSDQPIYRQIVDELIAAIQQGYLKGGEKLPSTRDLGKALGISRFTVMRSYEDLVSAGYVTIATGSGAFVSNDLPQQSAQPSPSTAVGRTAERKSLSHFAQQAVRAAQFEPGASQWHSQLNYGAPAFELLPLNRWKEVLYLATREIQTEDPSLRHNAFGRPELREAVAEYVSRSRRVKTSSQSGSNIERVVIFSSFQNALDFVLRLLVDPGEACALESPGLPDLYRSFLACGATVHPVTVDSAGMSARALNAAETSFKVICASPSRNEPTGATMSSERRVEILRAAADHNAYVIENDLGHEYRYGQKPIPSIQGMDEQDRVIYIGAFGPVLSPLTRTAYVVLPEHLVATAYQIKTLIEPDYSPVDQIALAQLMQGGHFERHIKRTTELYAERRAALVHTLTSEFGDSARIITSGTGTQLTVRFNESLQKWRIVEAAARHGVSLVSLDYFYPVDQSKNEFIMAFAHLESTHIRSTVKAFAADLTTSFVAPTSAAVVSLGT